MSAPARPSDTYQYDQARRKRSRKNTKRERGVWVYIAADELRAAGFSSDEPAPFYRCRGYQRSRNAASVIVSLFREP